MRIIATILLLGFTFLNCKNEKKEVVNDLSKTESLHKKKPDSLVISAIDVPQIPKSINFLGKFQQGYKWTDASGENIVFLTETEQYRNKTIKHESEDSSDAELYAYSYHLSNSSPKMNWKISDFVHDCGVDIEANFIDNSLKITDLNNNGIAEVWTIYKVSCKGDISPSEMKIIMYEGNQKYAIRGESLVKTGTEEHGESQLIGGDYKMDDQFRTGPEVFRKFGKKLWQENMLEAID